MLVKDSSLEISELTITKNAEEDEEEKEEDPFKDVRNGFFIPCNRKQRVLLYVQFKYRSIDRIMIYDHRRQGKVTIPNDFF